MFPLDKAYLHFIYPQLTPLEDDFYLTPDETLVYAGVKMPDWQKYHGRKIASLCPSFGAGLGLSQQQHFYRYQLVDDDILVTFNIERFQMIGDTIIYCGDGLIVKFRLIPFLPDGPLIVFLSKPNFLYLPSILFFHFGYKLFYTQDYAFLKTHGLTGVFGLLFGVIDEQFSAKIAPLKIDPLLHAFVFSGAYTGDIRAGYITYGEIDHYLPDEPVTSKVWTQLRKEAGMPFLVYHPRPPQACENDLLVPLGFEEFIASTKSIKGFFEPRNALFTLRPLSGTLLYGLKVNGDITAMAAFIPVEDGYYLCYFGVVPHYRRLGHAKQLLTLLLDLANREQKKVYLASASAISTNLYLKNGFMTTGYYYLDDEFDPQIYAQPPD